MDSYDVFISCSRVDMAWGTSLARALTSFGLRCFLDPSAQPSGPARRRALRVAKLLVAIRGEAAARDLHDEVVAFDALADGPVPRAIVWLAVGRGAPHRKIFSSDLARWPVVTVDQDIDDLGSDLIAPQWDRAVREIATAARDVGLPVGRLLEGSSLPQFSKSARTALTYAAEMLQRGAREPSALRAAALLGTLQASADGGTAPTTGDVVKLVLARQLNGRGAYDTFAVAAAAADLDPLPRERPAPLDLDALAQSPAQQIVTDVIAIQKRTGARSVHLRHVLAVGVDPAVPEDVFAQLRITIDELRRHWRASIARTWPDESPAGWDQILREEVGLGTQPAAPPSARVHADLWTTEDRLNYTLYATAIAEFIRHPDASPPMVISIQAPWGQGKTSLMRMIQRNLDPQHPDLLDVAESGARVDVIEPPSELTFGELRNALDGTTTVSDTLPTTIRTVWFNAWKYQSSEQVWAGLADAILAQLPARLSARDRELFWLRLQLQRIDPSAVRNDIHRAALERFLPRLAGWAALALAALVVAGLSLLAGGQGAAGTAIAGSGLLGTALVARRAWGKAATEVLQRRLEGAYLRYVRQPDHVSKLGDLHVVEEDVRRALKLLTPDDQPAVIFIDDLDRCSPAKIGEVIEAVNLFLAGDFSNCAFVIGIDAEVVAASMEVVHTQIIDKLGERRGELGWRFMDKFVQLPFVMPRLHPEQREAYLRSLFNTPSGCHTASEVIAEAVQLADQVREEVLPIDELARRVGEIGPRLAAVAPGRARALGAQVVAAGAQAFSDSDPEVIQALADQLRYLSDNPRTIKRAVNLYRFHRFAAFARQASILPLAVATPEQIGRWIIVIVRWPQFVRWLQSQSDADPSHASDALGSVLSAAHTAQTVQQFKEALSTHGIDASWTADLELWQFLNAETHPDLSLDLAGPRGLW